METIKLKCQNCNGTLDVDPNREVISCPYCGEKTLVPESDEVKIAKSNNSTKEILSVEETKRTIHHDSALRDIEKDKNLTEIELKKLSIKEKENESKNELITCIFAGILTLAFYIVVFVFITIDSQHRETTRNDIFHVISYHQSQLFGQYPHGNVVGSAQHFAVGVYPQRFG